MAARSRQPGDIGEAGRAVRELHRAAWTATGSAASAPPASTSATAQHLSDLHTPNLM